MKDLLAMKKFDCPAPSMSLGPDCNPIEFKDTKGQTRQGATGLFRIFGEVVEMI